MWEKLPFEKHGPDGYYAEHDNIRYVHLLGTNHEAEWSFHRIRNLGRVQTPIGKVHPGYYDAAREVASWLLSEDGYVAVVLSAHSYGAAVAELVKAIMIGYGFNCELRTYGGIKAGRIQVTGHDRNTTHYRHRGDLATLWPPWPWYRRKGDTVAIGARKWPIEAHRIESYREALKGEGIEIP